MTVIRIVALSGSLRAASTNTALLRAVAASAPVGVSVEIVPLDDIPLFNPDLDDRLPGVVVDFRARVGEADGLIIASPEYAHGVSGVLKNALDWLVGSESFAGKPVQILNAAPRAFHGVASLREILATMSARLVDDRPLAGPGYRPAVIDLLADEHGSA